MGAEPIPLHPVRRWRMAAGYTSSDVSALVRARGRDRCSARYIESIEMGWRRPSYEICEILVALSNGAMSISDLRHWPLRGGDEKRAA